MASNTNDRHRNFTVRVEDMKKRIPFIAGRQVANRQKTMRLGVKYIDFLEKIIVVLMMQREGKQPPADAKKFSDFENIVDQVLSAHVPDGVAMEEPEMNREDFEELMTKYEPLQQQQNAPSSSSAVPIVSPQGAIPKSPAVPAHSLIRSLPSSSSRNRFQSPTHHSDSSFDYPTNDWSSPNNNSSFQSTFPTNSNHFSDQHTQAHSSNFYQAPNTFDTPMTTHNPALHDWFQTNIFNSPVSTQDPSCISQNQPGPSNQFPVNPTAQFSPPAIAPPPVAPLRSPMTFEEACANNMMVDYMRTPYCL